jgi:LacI family transcriptional regulator
MRKRTSMKDIADKVGVSTALVSYVLNGLEKEKRVGAEIVKKIHQTAKEMNYQPNQIASSLRKGKTNSIGLIVANISNPFFAQLARTIEDEASKFNFTVIFGSSDGDCSKSASLINTFLNRQVDGFIIVPSDGCSEQIKSLIQDDNPVVLIDRYLPGISANYVVLDNFMATYSAVKCFISNGYNKICLIAYKSSLSHMQERIRGYKEAMKDNGLEKEMLVKEVRYNFEKNDLEQIIYELLKEKKVNALLFATNTLSVSGLYVLKKYNINVPHDMAVIGFDHHEVFDFFQPQITHIQQPLEDMGKESVKILIEMIKGSSNTVHMELKHQLIERESSG